ncbi:MAG: hypothetical protein A2439_01835 [Candidatus Staskawiczbacteria bacterium RIFOXYC2_FULL_37_17]|nr:MAG: hypothetical protein A2891_00905 [Candidatus Staskawiczbacteria bacterium RIFCSPLOWO2_01_FULL_37_19]OGZ86657.1 MAG: hypothetical protein A2439_01835 [Candidatus Staskawiczbacteria bacterium RIFOXYC2_FULL_37_17]OGZ92401.1 MAG: hypothetical protein A2549_00955 [Candidatus Staskawiczbacteria bacterium RIFOXYD2_FULL_37_10]
MIKQKRKIKIIVKSYKNTILPQIKLKYFKRPDIKLSDHPRTNYTCDKCGMNNIPFIGAVKDGYSKNPKYFCEDCAIDAYMSELGFESRDDRAIFDQKII